MGWGGRCPNGKGFTRIACIKNVSYKVLVSGKFEIKPSFYVDYSNSFAKTAQTISGKFELF